MQPRHRRFRVAATAATAVGVALAAAACSSGTSGSSGTGAGTAVSTITALSRAYAGQTISVLLPPWGNMAQSQLAKFTAATGIKVSLTQLAWDSIHDKVVSAESAGVAPADVTEVDWSWVGQFGAAGWYTPLNKWLPSSLISGSTVSSNFDVKGE
jgi:multiple sugar transport system substrate-binding protein